MSKLDLINFIKMPIKKVVAYLNNFRSGYYLKKSCVKKKHEIIKVGFIVQMSEIWDKQSSVYTKMCKNKLFEPWLIIVPKYDIENSSLGKYGSDKDFFISNCLNGKYVLAYNESNWVDIDLSKYDYLFYQRPYDFYLPKHLKSSNTVRFTKNCYIPYATPEIKNTVIYPIYFFRNIYMGFMEDSGSAIVNRKRFKNNCQKGYQHFLNVGYPTFEKCLMINGTCNYVRYLWTPRWSYDPIVGGSHFIEYYQQLTDFKWNNSQFTIRPHPMMWENFVKTGILEKTRVDEIISLWKTKGINVDTNKSIEDTYESTDVLISDRSSVIPMFFLTGKPIIYCPIECEYGSLFAAILPGLYIANTWEELSGYIKMLSEHTDPLKNIRQKIIEEHFEHNSSATENIVNSIIDDFEKTSRENR